MSEYLAGRSGDDRLGDEILTPSSSKPGLVLNTAAVVDCLRVLRAPVAYAPAPRNTLPGTTQLRCTVVQCVPREVGVLLHSRNVAAWSGNRRDFPGPELARDT